MFTDTTIALSVSLLAFVVGGGRGLGAEAEDRNAMGLVFLS